MSVSSATDRPSHGPENTAGEPWPPTFREFYKSRYGHSFFCTDGKRFAAIADYLDYVAMEARS